MGDLAGSHAAHFAARKLSTGGAPLLQANQANRTELLKRFAAVY
jgi:hypothetical protein